MNLKRRDFLRWMLIQLGVLFGGEMLSACAPTGSDERPEEGHSPTPIDPERNPYEDAIPLDDQIVSFENINVIPMNQERVLFDQTVIIQGGRIQEIGPASSIRIPDEATRVYATDKYLLPGYSDMHIHLEGDAWNIMFPDEDKFAAEDLDFERLLFPYISNGVVMAEIMSALPDHIPLRDQIDRGEKMGPRLILARMIDGPGQAWPPPVSTWVDTASEARSAVLGAREQGYDRMKVYSFLKPECYDAILATAKEMNMLVDGHIPNALSVEYVLEAGQNMIAHSEEVMKHAHGNFDRAQIDYFADLIAESNTWITPTLITTRKILALLSDLKGELSRPEAQDLHPMARGIWSYIIENMYLKMPSEAEHEIRRAFESFQRPFTKALYDRGVKLLTGTDSLIPPNVPGYSLHLELEELVSVGLSPYEALRSSTTHPIEFIGELELAGTIEVGKRADLVLLEENPLEEITNSRKIAGVMLRGRWFPKADLQKRQET